jgi:hypothetical protein
MYHGMRGIELFFAGWILALTTYYLGALDTGVWVSLAVTGVEILGLSLMLAGIRQITEQHRKYRAAGIVVTFTLVASITMMMIQVISLGGITLWVAIAAIIFEVAGGILFMVLSGLVLLGVGDLVRQQGNQFEANKLVYLWSVFLTFAILYMVMQVVAVLLSNEGLTALTFIVPAMGIPLLITGAVLIVRVYQIHGVKLQESK